MTSGRSVSGLVLILWQPLDRISVLRRGIARFAAFTDTYRRSSRISPARSCLILESPQDRSHLAVRQIYKLGLTDVTSRSPRSLPPLSRRKWTDVTAVVMFADDGTVNCHVVNTVHAGRFL